MQPILITRFQKRPSSRLLFPRFCSLYDLKKIADLQKNIYDLLPDTQLFVLTREEEWLPLLTAPSRVIGLWDGDTLAAYGIYLQCGYTPQNYAWKIGVPSEEVPFWANMDTVVVAPDYRGNRLEHSLILQMEKLCDSSIHGFCCTVSPDNQYSLHNVQEAGYEIAGHRKMYGGFDRLILKKERDL